jgi:hypothetical protein
MDLICCEIGVPLSVCTSVDNTPGFTIGLTMAECCLKWSCFLGQVCGSAKM